MHAWKTRLQEMAIAGSLLLPSLALIGCGPAKSPPTSAETTPSANEAANVDLASFQVVAIPVGDNAARYDQSFEEAAIVEVLDGQQQPPDFTIAGKGTAKLRAELERVWPSIPLAHKGRTIPYVLRIDSDEGEIEITLQPQWAPNQVRNFIALSRIGYYDGLCFERLIHEASEDGKERIDLVTAGCPLGTGEEGFGHLGYFLRADFPKGVIHEEGTVGFWRETDNKDAVGCRFYISLGAAPALDGQFVIVGKVTKGLEVVKTIAAKPVKGMMEPENQQPSRPVILKKIAVEPDPLEKSGPIARNTTE